MERDDEDDLPKEKKLLAISHKQNLLISLPFYPRNKEQSTFSQEKRLNSRIQIEN